MLSIYDLVTGDLPHEPDLMNPTLPHEPDRECHHTDKLLSTYSTFFKYLPRFVIQAALVCKNNLLTPKRFSPKWVLISTASYSLHTCRCFVITIGAVIRFVTRTRVHMCFLGYSIVALRTDVRLKASLRPYIMY